ncbi:unnamed protein product [Linum trigynum]|uniref:Methyltransferase n=1 Tax=Linum trigynum TaxID=586398 RepID=A0AAV2GL69_9ROSI
MVVKGDKIVFPGGGTHFHYGADKYITSIANMLNFSNNVLNDDGNFALERGIPAYLGVLVTKTLPYPSRSFEFSHCSHCRIDWLQRDGILLLELDRVLRPGDDHQVKGSGLAPWPARLTTPPPRLADFGYSNDMFEKDVELWRRRVESYLNILGPKIQSDTIRNVMDMKANLGSFTAALNYKDVWVMNVVPEDGPNTLKVVYDRGLIGTIHSWCESFSTYPRTYDLLHA